MEKRLLEFVKNVDQKIWFIKKVAKSVMIVGIRFVDKLFSVTKNDFIIEFIRGSGPGGQHRNKCSTGVRLTHKPSGAMATATDSKSQIHNKENAFKRIIETKKFKA